MQSLCVVRENEKKIQLNQIDDCHRHKFPSFRSENEYFYALPAAIFQLRRRPDFQYEHKRLKGDAIIQ